MRDEYDRASVTVHELQGLDLNARLFCSARSRCNGPEARAGRWILNAHALMAYPVLLLALSFVIMVAPQRAGWPAVAQIFAPLLFLPLCCPELLLTGARHGGVAGCHAALPGGLRAALYASIERDSPAPDAPGLRRSAYSPGTSTPETAGTTR